MPFFAKGDRPSKRKSMKGKKSVKGSQDVKLNSRALARARLENQLAKEDVDSSSDEEQMRHVKRWKGDDEEDKIEDTETAQEKKERLAKQILKELQEQREEQEAESEDDISVPVQQRLRDEVLEASGKLFRRVAKNYSTADQCSSIKVLQCKKFQRKTITCVAVSLKDSSIFASSWDGSIVKYSSTGEKLGIIKSKFQESEGPRHSSEILTLALNSDGKYLVSGDKAGVIRVWDAATLKHVDVLRKHRGAVTGLAFQRNTLSLFSCGLDRLVMEWSLDNMAYVDNLGGHSSGVMGIDALYRQSCISCGGTDETVMIYSIPEDKQFQFQTKQISIDGVKLLNENTFITYGQDGSLCLWSTNRKRPVQQLKVAHGYHDTELRNPHWITALAALLNTDLVASGSSDGFIRLWRVDNAQGTKLHAISRIAVPPGTINSLQFSSDGSMLVAALSRTHKHGRWFLEKKAKNCVLVITFPGIKCTKPTPLRNTLDADSHLTVHTNGVADEEEATSSEESDEILEEGLDEECSESEVENGEVNGSMSQGSEEGSEESDDEEGLGENGEVNGSMSQGSEEGSEESDDEEEGLDENDEVNGNVSQGSEEGSEESDEENASNSESEEEMSDEDT